MEQLGEVVQVVLLALAGGSLLFGLATSRRFWHERQRALAHGVDGERWIGRALWLTHCAVLFASASFLVVAIRRLKVDLESLPSVTFILVSSTFGSVACLLLLAAQIHFLRAVRARAASLGGKGAP